MNSKLSAYATLPLRFGVGFVFLYFGLGKFLWAPAGIAPTINFFFGVMELFVAFAMFLGVFVRQAAITASALLILIISSFVLKYGKFGFDTVFRDAAILGAALSLIVRHHDPWCLEKPKNE